MNFLGHFTVSYPAAKLTAGNLLGEFRHGNIDKLDLPEDIKNGIILHRQIDSFTDQNDSVKQISEFFREDFGRYATILSDICLDYYFARDRDLFPDQASLEEFSQNCYGYLLDNIQYFHPDEQRFIQAMATQDWLGQYSSLHGISKSMSNLISRSKYMGDKAKLESAIATIEQNDAKILPHYHSFKRGLAEFFPTALILQA